MKLFISKILNKLGQQLIKASRLFYVSSQEKRCVPWFLDKGDKTLRLDCRDFS